MSNLKTVPSDPFSNCESELVAIAGHHQQGRARSGVRRDHVHQIVVHARNVAGVIRDVLDQDLVLCRAWASYSGTINRDRVVDAAKTLHRIECNVETQIRGVRTARVGAFQPDATSSKHFVFVIDHRRPQETVGQHVQLIMQQSVSAGVITMRKLCISPSRARLSCTLYNARDSLPSAGNIERASSPSVPWTKNCTTCDAACPGISPANRPAPDPAWSRMQRAIIDGVPQHHFRHALRVVLPRR